MDANEFTDKLSKSFPKDVNNNTIDEIQSWIYNKNIPGEFLDELYKKIIEEHRYKTFPSYATIVKAAQQVFSDIRKKEESNYESFWRAEKEFKDWDAWELLDLLKKIDKKDQEIRLNDELELTIKELDVLLTFKTMLEDYKFMKEKNWGDKNIYNRIKFVQDKICKYQDVTGLWYAESLRQSRTAQIQKQAVNDLVKHAFENKILKRENPEYFQD